MKKLQLVVREGCHLCDEFEDLLEHHPLRDQFELERVVINRDGELESLYGAKYGAKVPVLLVEKGEICHYFLNEERLIRALKR